MTSFSLTELNRAPGMVVEAAHQGPVELTGRGKRKFVLLSVEDYDRLNSQPKRAFHIQSMTDGELDYFYAGLGGTEADET